MGVRKATRRYFPYLVKEYAILQECVRVNELTLTHTHKYTYFSHTHTRTHSLSLSHTHTLPNHLLIYKPSRVLPHSRRAVDRVPEAEPPRVPLLKPLQHVPHQNVFFGLIRKEEGEGGRGVRGLIEDGRDDLEHGSDARASG